MPRWRCSPYAASKVAGEASASRGWANCYELDTVSLRYFNIFGPRQNANSAYAAVIAAFAKAMLAGKPPMIFGDGEQSRDFTYVDNASTPTCWPPGRQNRLRAMSLTSRRGDRSRYANWPSEWQSSCGDQISNRGLRRFDPAMCRIRADISLAKKSLGYEPVVDFESGLKATVEWYESQYVR